MFKRVALFLATNLAVMLLLSVVMAIFGIDPRTNSGLLVMAAMFGFGGSIISLLMSKWIAKKTTGAHVIQEPRNEVERWLVQTVRRQAEAAGIGMPEVAIYDAPEINAFATGANRNNALVAVSMGLLRSMDRDEAEAVLAHEVSHVANGDMVTMALLQGVLNTFVIVLARVVGGVVDGYLSGNRNSGRRGFASAGARPLRLFVWISKGFRGDRRGRFQRFLKVLLFVEQTFRMLWSCDPRPGPSPPRSWFRPRMSSWPRGGKWARVGASAARWRRCTRCCTSAAAP